MKLVQFALRNYRSIKRTERIALGDLTVLVGPNNEGKSNILEGLVAGMRLLAMHAAPARPSRRGERWIWALSQQRAVYSRERDLPISLQVDERAETTFDFGFELSSSEVEEFRKDVGSSLNGHLPVRLRVRSSDILFEVHKQGRGAKTLGSKAQSISRFIGSRIVIDHIPTIRTGENAVETVRHLVESELRDLEESEEYQQAVDKVAQLQRPVLEELGAVLRDSLGQFLPEVKAVHVEVRDRLSALRRECQVVIDDGVPTPLSQKGDGVKSLAAISLSRHLASQSAGGSRAVILALEEPEAHLHPQAVQELRTVLGGIAQEQQVVITTHSPLLINRADIRGNVIVHRNRARAAQSVTEIREVLGVRVADNLVSASLVLLVEGETDVVGLAAILRDRSDRLADSIKDGSLALISMRGVKNLASQVALYRNLLCSIHLFVDYDKPARDAVDGAKGERLLDDSEVTYAEAKGMKDSEIEDLYAPSVYASALVQTFGVAFPTRAFDARRATWSERMNEVFRDSGRRFSKADVKRVVAQAVAGHPEGAVAAESESVIDALISNLESKLG